MVWLRSLAVGALLLGWALSAHLASAGHLPQTPALLLGLMPFAGGLLLLPARLGRVPLRLPAVVLALLLLGGLWPWLTHHVSLLYYLEHCGIHLALAAFFGRSLQGDQEALITRLARLLHAGQPLSPLHQRYTRQATLAWTLFFAIQAVISTLLYLFAPIELWSGYAYLLTAPLTGLMFIAEFLVRCRVLPASERPGFMEAIRAYRQYTAATPNHHHE